MAKQKKTQSKKQQKKGGVDFKKIKKKIGRKLPPAQNATNTEIKTKAITLPEQSVASDKTGLAVSKKGLTLKELLQQTSHHNAKVRKDALIGIRDIFFKHPAELKLHKLAAIEKLRERISDDDKLVRDTLHQLFKSVVLPGCKDDNQGPVISLLMAYIFNAMTHLAIDVRMMAFKFLDLIVQNFPSSFSIYGEKILQNYGDVLQKGHIHFQDKGKLKSVLAGLVHCLALLPCNKAEADSSFQNEIPSQEILHAFESDASGDSSGFSGFNEKLKDLLLALINCFQNFVPLIYSAPLLDGQSFDCVLFILESLDLICKYFCRETGGTEQRVLHVPTCFERKDGALLWGQLVPVASVKKLWDVFPLNAAHLEKENDRYFIFNSIIAELFFLSTGWDHAPSLLENFLGFIERSLQEIWNDSHSGKPTHEKHMLSLVTYVPKLLMQASQDWRYSILQAFTALFKTCNSESSMKLACLSVMQEMLDPEKDYLSLLTRDPLVVSNFMVTWIKELPLLLAGLGDKLPSVSKAVLRVQLLVGKAAGLHYSCMQEYNQMQYILKDFYASGPGACGPFLRLPRDVQDLSFSCLYYFFSLETPLLQSLLSCCLSEDADLFVPIRTLEVLQSIYRAGNLQIDDYISFHLTLLSQFRACPEEPSPGVSNQGKFRSIIGAVCSCMTQIGDSYPVFQMLESIVIDQLLQELPVDNFCALLRVLVSLDSKPTGLSEESVIKLSQVLPRYLLNIASDSDKDKAQGVIMNRSSYYLLPCFFLFDRTSRLVGLVLNSLGSFIMGNGPPFPHDSTYFTSAYFKRENAVISVLLLLSGDSKMKQILFLHKTCIESLLRTMLTFQSSKEFNPTIEEMHNAQNAINHLKNATGIEC